MEEVKRKKLQFLLIFKIISHLQVMAVSWKLLESKWWLESCIPPAVRDWLSTASSERCGCSPPLPAMNLTSPQQRSRWSSAAAVSEANVDRALLFRWRQTPEQLAPGLRRTRRLWGGRGRGVLAGGGGGGNLSAILACCFNGGFD